MATRSIEFENRRGRRLAARLELPDGGQASATALLAHCFTCGKDLKGLVRLSRTLTEHGFAVLRLDFTGLGESEGDFAEEGLGGDADDLEDAAGWLSEEIAAPSLLIGHSLGGVAALLVAERLPSLAAVATIGTPSDPGHVRQLVTGDPAELQEGESIETVLAGRSFQLPKRFFDELDARTPLQCLHGLKVPVAVLHAVTDKVVGIEHAERLFKAAKHPRKSYVSLGQADHLLSREADARFAGHAIGAWAAATLEASGDAQGTRATARAATGRAATARAATDGVAQRDDARRRLDERTTRAVTGEGYATDAYAGGFPLRADEPEKVGGTDTGPTPNELMRVALASCTSITLRMYADRKKWPVTSIEVEVDSNSERKQGTVHTTFERRVRLVGDLDDEQRGRLMEIADRCPVHRTLEGEVTIDTVEV
ncbi:MAG: alpha/beta fold hydrolase [Trueperaceae bacterium]|nr:alpha/beta fold hydrolase [Trueperaceae bacterium]